MPKTVRGMALALAGVCIAILVGGVANAAAERSSGPPQNSVAPAISGTPTEHKRLKTSHGTWTGAAPIAYTYAWSRCNSSGTECEPIVGATKSNYQPVAADVGHRLRATVTASNSAGTGEAGTAPSASIGAVAPKHKGNPTLSGEFVDGRLVTVGNGNWKGTPPFTYSYQWVRCGHGPCVNIAGAEAQSYRVQSADIGHKLRAIVTATNSVGAGKAKSKSSAKVVPGSPLNLAGPTISGTVLPGQTLTANNGSWTGTPPIAYAYQWLACAPLGGGCTEIAGATEQTYTVGAGEIGESFEVIVTATNAYGKASATSPETSITEGGVQPPENLVKPLITGLPVTGQTVTASQGLWAGTEPAYAYQWELCNVAGASCAEIGGATSSSFTIPDGDTGHTLRVIVTASNSAGTVSATSEATSEILGSPPFNTEAPTVSGTPTAGQLLTAASGKWTGTEPITYEYEWLRCNTSGAECVQAAAPSALPAYLVAAADVGHTLRVEVIATNVAGHGVAESAPTAIVGGVKPANAVAPAIVGLAITGQTLTATEGVWTGTEPISYAYQWELCDAGGAACSEIAGATKSSFTIPDGDAGHTLRVVVTASNVAGSTEATSSQSGEVLGVVPQNTEAPTVSGTATAGQILTASSGKWTGTGPIAYEYEWLRCNTGGSGCVQAAAPSVLPAYTVAAADVGHTLRAKVIAKNIAGSGVAESVPTATVAGVKPANAIAPTVIGLAITGQTLSATEGTWTGTEPIGYAFRWQLCSKAGTECADISGASKSTFTIPDGDAGHTLRVVVTASNVAGSTEKESSVTGEVTGIAPRNTEPPTVSGTAAAGQILTASSGKWTGTEPITYEYEWLRCNTSGVECTQAAAASILPTYTVAAADVGHTLRAKAIAKNIAGSASAESAATAIVAGVKPSNVLAPTVLGLAITGQTLSATEGTWTGTEPIAYGYRWQLCSKAGTECTDISGASKSTFTIPDGDAGRTLRVVVAASNVAGAAEKESPVTGEVAGVAPKNTELPKVTGEAKEGALLTTSSGKWTGTEPITYEYEWLRCNGEGLSCVQAQGASGLPTYTAVAADVGKTLRARVIARNIAGPVSAESEKTAVVLGMAPTNTVLPVTVPVGTTTSGSTVTVNEGLWSGTKPMTFEYEWKLCTSATSCKVEQKGASNSFKVPASSGGKKLRVNVLATNAAGKAEKEALELSILI